MPYITLSDQVKNLHNPRRSDTFVKQLRAAVRERNVVAADLPARFTLPKQYVKRGIDATPAFEAWFETGNRELSPSRTGGRIKVSAEAIEAGLLDFKALAAQTRERTRASFRKGQVLARDRTEAKQPKAPAKGEHGPAKRK